MSEYGEDEAAHASERAASRMQAEAEARTCRSAVEGAGDEVCGPPRAEIET